MAIAALPLVGRGDHTAEAAVVPFDQETFTYRVSHRSIHYSESSTAGDTNHYVTLEQAGYVAPEVEGGYHLPSGPSIGLGVTAEEYPHFWLGREFTLTPKE